jgi:hypothetical protein
LSYVQQALAFSESESKRFNANVYRGKLERVSSREILNFVSENNVDFIFFRISSDKLNQVINLDRTPFPYLVADNLLYYSCNLKEADYRQLRNKDLVFEQAKACDAALLENMVTEIFDGYKNHYFTNPFLDKTIIVDGYKEWVINYLNGESSKLVFKASKNGEVIAFATCSFDQKEGNCEGVLYGVLPQFSGGGIYTDLIRHTKNYFKEQNYRIMKVSTQSHNFAVQKTWVKENFFLSESYNTIHVNSLFNISALKKDKFDIIFKEEDLVKTITFSGDDNKLHVSDEFAKQCGFEAKIAHGLLLNAFVSRHFGKVKPGDGTVFLNYSYYFYQPLYLNKKYIIEISYPQHLKETNKYFALVKIYDQRRNICAVSYNQLSMKH